MITVSKINNELVLKFNYYQSYIDRVKSIGGRYNSDEKYWVIPISKIYDLKAVFKGELFFKTPEWIILNQPMPDYSKLYALQTDIDIAKLGFKLKPFKYQEFGIKFLVDRLIHNRFAFICDGVGLGKTNSAIGCIKYLTDNKLSKNILIVCKKSIKEQWKSEIDKFINFDGDVFISDADMNKPKREAFYKSIQGSTANNNILIVNYHLVLSDFDILSKMKLFDMVVYDEAQALKGGKDTAKACQSVTASAKYCLFMTATPVMSKADDLYSIISVFDKKYFGNRTEFEKRYIVKSFNGKYTSNIGFKNLDELRNKVQSFILRRTENEVDIELPTEVETKIMCKADKYQIAIINRVKEKTEELNKKLDEERKKKPLRYDEIAKLEARSKGLLAVSQAAANDPRLFYRAKSIAIRNTYQDLLPTSDKYSSNKFDAIMDLVNNIKDSGEKVILFTKYETVTQLLSEHLQKGKVNNVTYTGDLNENDRKASIRAFTNDDDIVALIGTDAMAEGLSLQFANHIIHVDMCFDAQLQNQRNGRIRRVGSKHKTCFNYILITEGSIDENIYNKVKASKNTFDALVSLDEAQSKLIKELSN